MIKHQQLKYMIHLCVILFLLFSFIGVKTPVNRHDEGISSYECIQDTIEEDHQRILVYKDKTGEIVAPADKGYAYIVQDLNDHNQVILESYYDKDHQPYKRWADHYALGYCYNDEGDQISYYFLDRDHHLFNTRSHYATVKREYKDHLCISESFYDVEDHLVCNTSNVAIQKYHRDALGYIIQIDYYDQNDHPTYNTDGISIVKRKNDDLGRVVEERYYDCNLHPVMSHSLGVYGYQNTLDEYGRVIERTYIDASNHPMINSKGYSTVAYSYYKDNTIHIEKYYDTTHHPIKVNKGYGLLHEGEYGQYLDQDGKPIFYLDSYLLNHGYITIIIGTLICVISLYCSKKVNQVLLILYILFILYMTLYGRIRGNVSLQIIPLSTYLHAFINHESMIHIIENIWLFIPFTIIGYKAYDDYRILLLGIGMSISIEMIQYFFKLGSADIDDVFSNTVGVLMGYLMYQSYPPLFIKKTK